MKIPFAGTFTQDDLSTTFDALDDVFFLQVGAMDGKTYDPIHPFVKRKKWRGILVEPIPHQHKKLRENYAGCEGLTFVETAITDFDGVIDMVTINPETEKEKLFNPGAYGLSSVMTDKGRLGGKNISEDDFDFYKQHMITIEVTCCRLEKLLSDNPVSKLDLVVIDTEGGDWMVLRQLPLSVYKPRVIFFEYCHLSDYEKLACATHLRNNGYRAYLSDGAENVLAIRDY